MNKMQKAIISLLQGDGIFYASLLMQMQIMDGKDLPKDALAAVSVQNGRIKLWVDPPRLEPFTIDEVAMILEHEALHLVMVHLSRLGSKHPYIWNIACDLAVNSLIPSMKNSKMPGCYPGRDVFASFPVEKSADFYYALLRDKIKNYTVTFNADGSVTVKDDKTGKKTTINPSGSHKDWNKASGGAEESLAREVIKQAVEEATRQVKKSQGRYPAGLEEIIKELLGKEKVNWKRLFKQYVGNAVKSDRYYTWKRESKRYGVDQKGRDRTRILDIAVAIDTSGSISTEDFQEFISEIYGIQKSYKASITIIECDAEVQKVYQLKRYQKVDTKFKGRGGTNFCPVFRYFEEKKKRPALLIFFTDMAGSFPDKETVRTLWIATSSTGEDAKAPFGRCIKLPSKNERNDS